MCLLLSFRLVSVFVFLTLLSNHTAQCLDQYKTLSGQPPLVIGHRGASGLRPAHTLASYALAIEQGADFIEPDLLMTKDGVLICRHEPMLSMSTNVASFPEFAERRTWKAVSGLNYHDWFASDFTLEEIKKLGATQNNHHRSQEYNGLFKIATFDEVIELAKIKSAEVGRTIGIYPELKHPIFHKKINLPLTDKFLEVLDREGWNHCDSPVYVQSSEVAILQDIRSRSSVKLMQLYLGGWVEKNGKVNPHGIGSQPYDFIVDKDKRSFTDLTTDKGLDFVKSYADVIGVWTPYIIPYASQDLNHDNKPDGLNHDKYIDNRDYIALPPTDLIERAHKKGLQVHVWTLKNEKSALLSDYQGDPIKECEALIKLGVDGMFSDFPGTAYIAREGL